IVQTTAVSVHVPAGEVEDRLEMVDSDVTNAALDQASCQQTALTKGISAIAVALLGGLPADVEGRLGFFRGEQAEGPLIGAVVHLGATGLGAALESIELGQQTAAGVQAGRRGASGDFEI